MVIPGYTRWAAHLRRSFHNPPPDVYAACKSEGEWARGVARLRVMCQVVLVDAAATYTLHRLQMQAFLAALPTTLPYVFGPGFYRQSEAQIHDLLQTVHRKLFCLYIGARRDGKSVVQALLAAALLVIGYDETIILPAFGPALNTGIRMVANASAMLHIKNIAARLVGRLKPTAQKVVVERGTDLTTFQAFAPTEKSLRGISPIMELGDEMFAFKDAGQLRKLYLARYAGERVGAFWVTTPNGDHAWTQDFQKSTDAVHIVNNAKICNVCRAKVEADSGLKFEEVASACEAAGHVEPLDIPWKSKKLRAAWGPYFDNNLLLQEVMGVAGMGNETHQFRQVLRDHDIFSQFAHSAGFSRFDIGIDPADYGASELAIAMTGMSGQSFQLLAAATRRLREADRINEWLMDRIQQMIEHVANMKYLRRGACVYVWVESPGHHGRALQEMIEARGYGRYVRVMRAMDWNSHTKVFDRYCVAKTRPRTEQYTAVFRQLIKDNRFKINAHLWTSDATGAKGIREKLRQQMNGYVRNEVGKLTGKPMDDLLIATYMPPVLALESMDPGKRLSEQLAWIV